MDTTSITESIERIHKLQEAGDTVGLINELEMLLLIYPDDGFQSVADTLISVYIMGGSQYYPRIGNLINNFNLVPPFSLQVLKGALLLSRARYLKLLDQLPAVCERPALLKETSRHLKNSGMIADDLYFIANITLSIRAWEQAETALMALLAWPDYSAWALVRLTWVRLQTGQQKLQAKVIRDLIRQASGRAAPIFQRLLVLLGEPPVEAAGVPPVASWEKDKVINFLRLQQQGVSAAMPLGGEKND